MTDNSAPRYKIPDHPQLEAALNDLALSVDRARTPEFKAGRGISVTSSKDSVLIEALPPEGGNRKTGRFIVSFDFERQRVYVGDGAVCWLDPDKSPQSVEPEIPKIDGHALGDAEAYFDATSLDPGADLHAVVVMDEGSCLVELRTDGEVEDSEEDTFEFAIFKLKEGGEGKLVMESLDQNWASDIPWVKGGSSAGGPSGGSSDGSSDGSDEKSSNAIVDMEWHVTGCGALATVESNQVLFEFILRGVPLKGRVTRIAIDRRFRFVCEPGSFVAMGSFDKPYPVGVEVAGDVVILTCLPFLRPSSGTIRLTGIRKGFLQWDMPSRTQEQKAQAEASNRAQYTRRPGQL